MTTMMKTAMKEHAVIQKVAAEKFIDEQDGKIVAGFKMLILKAQEGDAPDVAIKWADGLDKYLCAMSRGE